MKHRIVKFTKVLLFVILICFPVLRCVRSVDISVDWIGNGNVFHCYFPWFRDPLVYIEY